MDIIGYLNNKLSIRVVICDVNGLAMTQLLCFKSDSRLSNSDSTKVLNLNFAF